MKLRIITFVAVFFAALTSFGSDPATQQAALPRLVDLGASRCIPCRMMTPVLDELSKEYAGQMDVVFIDVWQNRDEGERYGVRAIPTQIFYGADGKELFRHEGYYPKAEILAKWKDLGVELKAPQTESPKP